MHVGHRRESTNSMQQQFAGYGMRSKWSSVCVILRDVLLHPGHQGIYYLCRYWSPRLGLQCWLWSGCTPMAKRWSVSGDFWKERLWCGSTTMQVGAQPPPLFFLLLEASYCISRPGREWAQRPHMHLPLTESFSISLTCLSVAEYGWNVSLGVDRDEYRGKGHRWGKKKDRV